MELDSYNKKTLMRIVIVEITTPMSDKHTEIFLSKTKQGCLWLGENLKASGLLS